MSFPAPPSGPAGHLDVRTARPEDYGVFVRFFAELWVEERPASEDRLRREMMASTLIAEAGGAMEGGGGPGPPQAVGCWA